MAFPEGWTEVNENEALEGLDVNKKDSEGRYTFADFRKKLVSNNGWTGNKQESQLLYALFTLYVNEPKKLDKIATKYFDIENDKLDILTDANEYAEKNGFNKENPEQYFIINEAYKDTFTVYMERRMEEDAEKEEVEEQKEAEDPYAIYIRDLWMQREAAKRAYERSNGEVTVPALININSQLYSHYERRMIDVEIEVEGDKRTIGRPFSTFKNGLDDIQPTNWTEAEESKIETYVKAMETGSKKINGERKAEEEAREREEAEDKKLARMSPDQIKEIRAKVKSLREENGIDINEFEQSPGFRRFCEKYGYDHNSAESPIYLAYMSDMGPNACAELLKYNVTHYDKIMESLNNLESYSNELKAADPKARVYDAEDAESIGRWLNCTGHEYLNKNIEENGIEVFDFEKALDKAFADRDNAYGFEPAIVNEAKKLYQDNKLEFDRAFGAMANLGSRHVAGQAVLRHDRDDLKKLDRGAYPYKEDTLKNLNKFCHLLYQVKQRDEKTCKLGTDEKPIFVEPLTEDTDMSDEKTKLKETGIIDKCYDMLKKSMALVNSGEYKKIMTDLKSLKGILNKKHDSDQEAKDEYLEGIKTLLKDINIYRKHKADDGIKQDVTLNKLVNVERIDKLFQTRYESLSNGKQFEDEITKTVEDGFDPKVGAQYGNGKNFVLALAYKKISGISRNKEKLERELDEVHKKSIRDKKDMNVEVKQPRRNSL